MSERAFGEIPSYPEGSSFASRSELSLVGVHRPTQAGISGSSREGADSIVLSGGYEDDEDHGDEIIYTGHGGRDPKTGVQDSDQNLTRGNMALALNKVRGLPVRVIRGSRHSSPYSPASGYRYDGLYRVDDYWRERGISGFYVWRYRLVKIDFLDGFPPNNQSYEVRMGERQASTVLRTVRDTAQAKGIKEIYDYCCQMCGVRLEGTAGPYAEAAHIRPIGKPHNGPDTPENILCLCPNHHVLFDLGGVAVSDQFTLLGERGSLNVHPEHLIDRDHLRYHREHYAITLSDKKLP